MTGSTPSATPIPAPSTATTRFPRALSRYVLRAFRDNKPFDQFTREQLPAIYCPMPPSSSA